jgi:hypothetical protein
MAAIGFGEAGETDSRASGGGRLRKAKRKLDSTTFGCEHLQQSTGQADLHAGFGCEFAMHRHVLQRTSQK